MSNHDAAWEASLRPYMRNQRLLVAKNIHFREAKAEFEVACRAALRKPDSVTFFWRDADVAGRKHRGQAMLAFANRPDCRDALEDLRGLIVRGRSVNVVKGSKHAFGPPRAPPPATNTTAPGASTSSADPTVAAPVAATYTHAPASPAPAPAPAPASTTPAVAATASLTAAALVPEAPEVTANTQSERTGAWAGADKAHSEYSFNMEADVEGSIDYSDDD